MADIKGLADEINNDPLSRGYSSMTDQEVADDLNTTYRIQYVDVSVGELAGKVELEGIYEKLDAASTAEAVKLLRLASNKSPVQSLSYSNTTQRAQIDGMLDQLVADAVISESDRTKLQELGMRSLGRAEELSLLGASPSIGPAHVEKARNL